MKYSFEKEKVGQWNDLLAHRGGNEVEMLCKRVVGRAMKTQHIFNNICTPSRNKSNKIWLKRRFVAPLGKVTPQK